VSTTQIPTREQLVLRAAELVPTLRKHAPWSEQNRRLHDDVVTALRDAGMFKLRTPKRYGGYEVDTRTLVEVASELGRADGSASWVTSVYWIPTWMACQFPDSVQDDIFAKDDATVCGTLSPSAMAKPADGGVVVNGKWGFISGALHSEWQEIIAIFVPPDGEPYPIMALVPLSDLLVVDDWHVVGLKGSGSVSTVAQDVFIPQERILPLPVALSGDMASEANADAPIYRPPLLPVACATSVGTAIGLARAAREVFFKRLPDRKITYTEYEKQKDAPLTHLQVAEATQKIEQAEWHAQRLATLVDTKGEEGSEWKLEERAQCRGDLGAVCRLAKEAVDIYRMASGGSSVYTDVPMHRIAADIQAINLHALMNPNTNAELYGRVLCGLEPNTPYI
jgi:alkylation response protein AidB-like acyl-CoA dehydrogenase